MHIVKCPSTLPNPFFSADMLLQFTRVHFPLRDTPACLQRLKIVQPHMHPRSIESHDIKRENCGEKNKQTKQKENTNSKSKQTKKELKIMLTYFNKSDFSNTDLKANR